MGDVAIDLERLGSTAARARGLAEHFRSAERFADDLGALTGHHDLAGKVEEFGNEWDNAREDLQDGLRAVADFMEAIHDTFSDLDRTMADGLKVDTAP